jgi:hypothetical protein
MSKLRLWAEMWTWAFSPFPLLLFAQAASRGRLFHFLRSAQPLGPAETSIWHSEISHSVWCWGQVVPVHTDSSLPNISISSYSKFSGVMMGPWNWPWQGYLQQRNCQTIQIRAFFRGSWLLNIYQDSTCSQKFKRTAICNEFIPFKISCFSHV